MFSPHAEKRHINEDQWERHEQSSKRPIGSTGKWEKGRECEPKHGYLRRTKDAQLRDAQQPPLLLSPSNTKPPFTAKFKFRCLPFYTAVLEVESKAKRRMYPALSCHVKRAQNFSVVLSPPTWSTFSAGKGSAVCAGKISRISNCKPLSICLFYRSKFEREKRCGLSMVTWLNH